MNDLSTESPLLARGGKLVRWGTFAVDGQLRLREGKHSADRQHPNARRKPSWETG